MEFAQDELITPDDLMEMGKRFVQECLDQLTLEEKLACINMRHLIQIIPPEELLAGLSPEQRMAGLSLEERLAGIPTEDILECFTLEVVEEFLKNHRQKHSA